MHYMFNRVGGLKDDLPAGWLTRVGQAVEQVRTGARQIEKLADMIAILGSMFFVGSVGTRTTPAHGDLSAPFCSARSPRN